MKNWQGVFTAIVTPFQSDGSIDWVKFQRLVELQIKSGVSGIVPCGTTGESPTLSHSEHNQVVSRVVEWVNGRCLVLAGTGSNATTEAVAMSMHAEEVGADGVLQVNPYYNKPTQEGLYRHFRAVANSIKIPVILYNIKGRTAVNLETSTLMRLIEACPNIVGVKEASGDIAQIKEVIQTMTPPQFFVLSGDDNMTYALLEAGGDGVVSVSSNLIPTEVVELVSSYLSGDKKRCLELHTALAPIFEGIFIETNPIPIKAALAMRGLCEEAYRLPLCEMGAENREKWVKILRSAKQI